MVSNRRHGSANNRRCREERSLNRSQGTSYMETSKQILVSRLSQFGTLDHRVLYGSFAKREQYYNAVKARTLAIAKVACIFLFLIARCRYLTARARSRNHYDRMISLRKDCLPSHLVNTYNSFYTNFLSRILYFVEHPLPLMSNECQHVWDVVSTNPYTKYICYICNLNHPPPGIYTYY